MENIIFGSLGFVILTLFDLNKVKHWNRKFNVLFALGVFFIVLATFLIFTSGTADFILDEPYRWLVLLLFILSLIQMIDALFGALPFKRTYIEGANNTLINTGWYALCRHPGVYGFFFTFLTLFLYSGKWMMLYATLVWTLFDILHVTIQDVYFFPLTIKGYTDYQKETPFLLFNKQSLRRFQNTWLKGELSK